MIEPALEPPRAALLIALASAARDQSGSTADRPLIQGVVTIDRILTERRQSSTALD